MSRSEPAAGCAAVANDLLLAAYEHAPMSPALSAHVAACAACADLIHSAAHVVPDLEAALRPAALPRRLVERISQELDARTGTAERPRRLATRTLGVPSATNGKPTFASLESDPLETRRAGFVRRRVARSLLLAGAAAGLAVMLSPWLLRGIPAPANRPVAAGSLTSADAAAIAAAVTLLEWNANIEGSVETISKRIDELDTAIDADMRSRLPWSAEEDWDRPLSDGASSELRSTTFTAVPVSSQFVETPVAANDAARAAFSG